MCISIFMLANVDFLVQLCVWTATENIQHNVFSFPLWFPSLLSIFSLVSLYPPLSSLVSLYPPLSSLVSLSSLFLSVSLPSSLFLSVSIASSLFLSVSFAHLSSLVSLSSLFLSVSLPSSFFLSVSLPSSLCPCFSHVRLALFPDALLSVDRFRAEFLQRIQIQEGLGTHCRAAPSPSPLLQCVYVCVCVCVCVCVEYLFGRWFGTAAAVFYCMFSLRSHVCTLFLIVSVIENIMLHFNCVH